MELARASKGRFSLGLGSQVKAHIERRFSMPFDHPGPKLREYVLALRAIWRAFQGEERLRFEGEFYSFSLLTDFFSPGPSDHPDIPIAVAGVNSGMARLAGRGVRRIPCAPVPLAAVPREVICPAIAEGADTAGRSAAACEIYCPVFVIVGDSRRGAGPATGVGAPPAVVLRLHPYVPAGVRAARLG